MGIQIRQYMKIGEMNNTLKSLFGKPAVLAMFRWLFLFFLLLTVTKQKANRVIRDENCERHAFIQK